MQKITPFLWYDNQAQSVVKTMLQMDKIDVKKLQDAYDRAAYHPCRVVN